MDSGLVHKKSLIPNKRWKNHISLSLHCQWQRLGLLIQVIQCLVSRAAWLDWIGLGRLLVGPQKSSRCGCPCLRDCALHPVDGPQSSCFLGLALVCQRSTMHSSIIAHQIYCCVLHMQASPAGRPLCSTTTTTTTSFTILGDQDEPSFSVRRAPRGSLCERMLEDGSFWESSCCWCHWPQYARNGNENWNSTLFTSNGSYSEISGFPCKWLGWEMFLPTTTTRSLRGKSIVAVVILFQRQPKQHSWMDGWTHYKEHDAARNILFDFLFCRNPIVPQFSPRRNGPSS